MMFEQDRLLMRLQQRVLTDSKILVCFLSGSYGRRTEDPYSDLDVALIFENNDARDSAYSERKRFVQSLMPYIPAKSFDAEHIRPYFHVALFSNGAKVDFRFETIDELKPSPRDHDIKLIKDTSGWGKRFQEEASRLSPIPPRLNFSSEELMDLDNRFWIMFMDIYRHLLRGDHDKPFPIYLEMLTFTIPTLRNLLPAEDPARSMLPTSHFDENLPATIAHMRRLLQAYMEARASVIRRYNLAFSPNDIFERSIIQLVDRTSA